VDPGARGGAHPRRGGHALAGKKFTEAMQYLQSTLPHGLDGPGPAMPDAASKPPEDQAAANEDEHRDQTEEAP
jgi:ribosomal protein L12E/L44/L45/RPP1/RPP2